MIGIGFRAFLVFLFSSNILFGQEFEWVYTTTSVDQFSQSHIRETVTDNQGNIYAIGNFKFNTDFDDSSQERILSSDYKSYFFIMEMDSQKAIKWIKYLKVHGSQPAEAHKILIDHQGNLIVTINHRLEVNAPFYSLQPDGQDLFLDPSGYQSSSRSMILKLDANGNYLAQTAISWSLISGIAIDSSNNLIVMLYMDYIPNVAPYWVGINKFDPNLNVIAGKSFPGADYTNVEENANRHKFNALLCDKQDNLYITAKFFNQIVFNGVTYQATGWSNFICKLNFSEEFWLIQTDDRKSELFLSDQDSNFYIKTDYHSSPLVFNNQTLQLPVSGGNEELLMKLNPQGNIIWSVPLFGEGNHTLSELRQNSFGQNIVLLDTDAPTYFKDDTIAVHDENSERALLLKLNSQGTLLETKGIDHLSFDGLTIEQNDDILICGSVGKTVNFDPDERIDAIKPIVEEERLAYILKLSNCDSVLPYGDANQTFCATQNPTVRNLKPNTFNVFWYDSISATQPLASSTPLENGKTYFAAKMKVDHCPEISGRLEVLVTINPDSYPPQISLSQPCYNSLLTLADLNIQGQNLEFYESMTDVGSIPASTLILADKVYFVSQKNNGCESQRIPVGLSSQSEINTTNFVVDLCDTDRDGSENVDLSLYNEFLIENYTPQTHAVSYHKSYQDAFDDKARITAFRNYKSANEKIYVRVFSSFQSCSVVAELTVNLVNAAEILEVKVKDWIDDGSLTVFPSNPNYLYSIDNLNYQSSNFFGNLSSGEYSVYVKDNKSVCGPVSQKVIVLGFPKFFTPNGDGHNDFWKIKFAVFQLQLNVEIYDRYGKLVAMFDKYSQGWDGKLNGKDLPASDYWFKIRHITQDQVIYTGHFSLVR